MPSVEYCWVDIVLLLTRLVRLASLRIFVQGKWLKFCRPEQTKMAGQYPLLSGDFVLTSLEWKGTIVGLGVPDDLFVEGSFIMFVPESGSECWVEILALFIFEMELKNPSLFLFDERGFEHCRVAWKNLRKTIFHWVFA